MSRPPRRVYYNVWRSFIDSFKIKEKPGQVLKGEDYHGTKYYEIAADPAGGKRKPSRWFEPVDKEKFDTPMPAEWDSWLRYRRAEPPSNEEVMKNLAIQHLKQKNAAILEEKAQQERIASGRVSEQQEAKGVYSFPKYEKDYKLKDDNDTKK